MSAHVSPLLAVPEATPLSRRAHPRRFEWLATLPLIFVHLGALASVWVGVSAEAVVGFAVLYVVRMFAVTAGYHRYFAHRTFKTSRVGQFVLAFLAQTSAQRGALWWAAHHRGHHKYSDMPEDPHSTKQDGFWYAHVGWIFNRNGATDLSRVRDLAKYPELVWLDRLWWLPPWVLGLVSYFAFGWSGLCFGFMASTVAVWHATFAINSLAHLIGRRRYATSDDSKNSLVLALLTLGEGWHNNHHHYMQTARQGFFWYEIDLTYYALKVLSWLGMVWDLRPVPAQVLAGGRVPD